MEFDDLSIKSLDATNIVEEHICCAMSDKKSIRGVLNKKSWMKSHFTHELHFKDALDPKFSDSAKRNETMFKDGVHIVYTDQCPFTDYYVSLLREVSYKNDIPFKGEKLTTPEQVQNAPSAYGTFSLFINGNFKTHVIPTENQFLKLLS